MATTRSFSAMLNDYITTDLLVNEIIDQSYVLKNADKDDSWLGGPLVFPFEAAIASSIKMGGLSDSSDIAEDAFVRGEITTQPEAWGTMIFYHRDLMEHGKLSEQNFLKILPGRVDRFLQRMKNVTSVAFTNGAHFAKLTAASTANDGVITVDRPDRFEPGQKVIVAAASNLTGYVKAAGGINLNTKQIILVTARGGSTVSNFSANNAAAGAKCYNDGFETSSFSSMKGILLSAANGGDSTVYGQTKSNYKYLQAINIDGSSVTSANLLEKIFDGFTETRIVGQGKPRAVMMSLRLWGFCLKIVEASKGAYNVVPGSRSSDQFGWEEIEIGSVTGERLKLVGIQEMDDDYVMFVDWSTWKVYSNGMFRRRKSPDGVEYFEQRATSGYSYIVDTCFFGDLVCTAPVKNGIMHSISLV